MRLFNAESFFICQARRARGICVAGTRSASASRLNVVGAVWVVLAFWPALSQGQTNNYFGASGSLAGSTWSTNVGGPYTSSFNTTGGGIANFGNAATFTGASITVAGINATANATRSSGSGTISNVGDGVIPIYVANGVTLDFGSQSFTGSTTAGYIKNGAGTLALAGNTYRGGFTLNAGTVVLHGVNAMGGGLSNVLTINGGTIAASASRSLSSKYGGGIKIGGDFTLGAPASSLIDESANISFSNSVDLQGATRTVTIGGKGDYTFGGPISNGGLIVNATNTGRVLLNWTNSYTGGTTVQSGTLVVGTNDALHDDGAVNVQGGIFQINGSSSDTVGLVTLSGGLITIGTGALTSNTGYAVQAGTITGRISGSGAVTKTTTGTVTLNGNTNNYTGGTFVNGGTLIQGATGQLPINRPISIDGGTLDVGDFDNTITTLTLVSGTLTGGTGVLSASAGAQVESGIISGNLGGNAIAYSLTKTTPGTVTIQSTNNSYKGHTYVNGGVLSIASIAPNQNGNSSIGNVTDGLTVRLQFGGGTLQYTGGNASTSRGFTLNAGGGTIDVEQSATTLAWSGNSEGTGDFTKAGDGTLELATGSTHTSTGSTFINAGTLLLNGSQTGGAGYSVGTGGTLGGSGIIDIGTNEMLVAGTLAPGNSPGTLTVVADMQLLSTALLDWQLAAPNLDDTPSGDRIDITGDLTLDGTLQVAALAGFGTPVLGDRWRLLNYSGNLTDSGLSLGSMPALGPGLHYAVDTSLSGQVDLTVVPEPSTLAMFVFGAILLGFFRASFARR